MVTLFMVHEVHDAKYFSSLHSLIVVGKFNKELWHTLTDLPPLQILWDVSGMDYASSRYHSAETKWMMPWEPTCKSGYTEPNRDVILLIDRSSTFSWWIKGPGKVPKNDHTRRAANHERHFEYGRMATLTIGSHLLHTIGSIGWGLYLSSTHSWCFPDHFLQNLSQSVAAVKNHHDLYLPHSCGTLDIRRPAHSWKPTQWTIWGHGGTVAIY